MKRDEYPQNEKNTCATMENRSFSWHVQSLCYPLRREVLLMGRPEHSAGIPLSSHVLFQSTDLDCAREQVARKFCRHRLEINGNHRPFRTRHHHLMGDMISLNYIEYGADVSIDPGALQDFYLIQIPISGAATIRNGNRSVHTDRTSASVLNPHLETRMRWMEGCRQILLQIKKAPFQAFANRVLDRDLPGLVTFDPKIDLAQSPAADWLKLVGAIVAAADDPTRRFSPETLTWALNEQRLMEGFLRFQPSNISVFLEDSPRCAAPRHLRRAREFICERSNQPITLHDIATAAGCSTRTLQLAYKSVYGATPLQALKAERLRRVRFDLFEMAAEASITDIAMKWGFNHLGRFAADYRAAFGELPRQTRADHED